MFGDDSDRDVVCAGNAACVDRVLEKIGDNPGERRAADVNEGLLHWRDRVEEHGYFVPESSSLVLRYRFEGSS